MKRILLIIFCFIMICALTACKVHPKVSSVEKSDYQKFTEWDEQDGWHRSTVEDLNNTLPTEYLDDAKAAAGRAESVWFGIYGEKEIKKQRPYRVSYDEQNGIWVVEGTLRLWPLPAWLSPMAGGAAYIVMQQEDGKILAVTHFK